MAQISRNVRRTKEWGSLRWYVASCRDGDAHLAAAVDGGWVTPVCGRPAFRPFTSLARPADPEQGCTGCLMAKAREIHAATGH